MNICNLYPNLVNNIDLGYTTKEKANAAANTAHEQEQRRLELENKKIKDTLETENKKLEKDLSSAKNRNADYVVELATANAKKNKAIAALAAANAQKDKINEELAAEKEAKKQVEAEFAYAKRKYQESEENFKLSTDNILTIDEDYFMNAYANAKIKYGKGEDVKAIKILDNIIAIWKLLKDDTKLKKNEEISKIINDEIPKLKRSYKEAPDWLNKGGKKISSRTKRK